MTTGHDRPTRPAIPAAVGPADVADDGQAGGARRRSGRRRRRRGKGGDGNPAGDPAGGNGRGDRRGAGDPPQTPSTYAALDLGTNNCRLLVANAAHGGFRIVDAFSRIVRLGEGVAATGALSEAAMDRTVDALKVCAQKMMKRGATRRRCIATQACRSAGNGAAFLARVRDETGIDFEIITPEEEARLAVAGCADLVDPQADAAIVFDIGGGSTEISFLARRETDARGGGGAALDLVAWLSIPFGVVTLSEKYGGAALSRDAYAAVISDMKEEIRRLDPPADVAAVFQDGRGHLLGTSGTVTSLAGVHLGLPKYRRDLIDGLWLTAVDARSVSERLRAMSLEGRAGEPCIGGDRADLVVCGCAIFEAILDLWPCERIRVADRGLREGVLAGLIEEDRRRAAKRRRAKTRARRRAAKRKEAGEPDRDKNGDA